MDFNSEDESYQNPIPQNFVVLIILYNYIFGKFWVFFYTLLQNNNALPLPRKTRPSLFI